ncbi:alpha,alpha-trehalose-phosphate synthase (UDP-forming) [Chelativorans salis]|uniref:Trehalose-6-phosphate synthase n=1 Tax=Chelativorans salis TaxID=2978478 RepID=A0ABT2LLA3_9HYPH|nr:alpha,alpha-trehalose-phosphate synthase (UDP-forming) [Chelativorans sp. EGI FJ00035]MCT7375159.1 alpha,alpha-trehalose-phosphate synthase (UDP-forming) [Chelativorans sp. EGI FJ00035]
MNRLVVVSNRVADLTRTAQSGGLAVGLADSLRQRGGVWMGWDGQTLKYEDQPEPRIRKIGTVTQATIPLTEQDYSEYYLGFANSVLWPLFHYRLDLVEYKTVFLDGYRRVNAKFADALTSILQQDDIIWIHDYHLIPLAAELRQRGCTQRIGFFLHIPFPPPEILAAVPRHRWLVECLLEFDVIGFQTHTDQGNLQHYVEDHLGCRMEADGRIKIGKREVIAGCYPIGIDVDSFVEMAERPNDEVSIETQRREILGRKQIIGVDRLDYTKGLPDRLRAFARLLELYPEMRKTVALMQIATPTREEVGAYVEIRTELEALSGAINGRFADFNWTPVRYIHGIVPRDALAALFRASQVGFVTPLRDGMNLVAKEYVAAQSSENPGVLVLSKFAGAAEELHEALIVNPYDVDDMARNLCHALTMPLEERKERQKALFARICKHDAKDWLNAFIAALEKGETKYAA